VGDGAEAGRRSEGDGGRRPDGCGSEQRNRGESVRCALASWLVACSSSSRACTGARCRGMMMGDRAPGSELMREAFSSFILMRRLDLHKPFLTA
jgi:hypothetical protein